MIKGRWYGEGSAASSAADFIIRDNHFTLEIDNGDIRYGLINELHISNRLGNVERKVTLKDGSVFATPDNDAIDRLQPKKLSSGHFLHSMESKLGWVLVCLVVSVLSVSSFFRWGIPWTSEVIAHSLPHKANELISESTFHFIDKYMLSPTKLDESEQNAIRSRFENQLLPIAEIDPEVDYQLHFRAWEMDEQDIPNALALPSGDIILTDKFIELAERPEEIDAVIFHEIGHVEHRHSIEMVVQSTVFSIIIMTVIGDTNALADIGVAVGSLLVGSHYSRQHETEADDYAFQKMLNAGIDPIHFANILQRMSDYMTSDHMTSDDLASEDVNIDEIASDNMNINNSTSETSDTSKEDTERVAINSDDTEESTPFSDYLSSHPGVEERSREAERYSECFHQGKRECPASLSHDSNHSHNESWLEQPLSNPVRAGG